MVNAETVNEKFFTLDELVLRLVTMVEGCPDFVNDVAIPWPRVVADQALLAGTSHALEGAT